MWWKLLTSRTAAQKQDRGRIGTLPRDLFVLSHIFQGNTYCIQPQREGYLHDKEEEEDDKDADVGMEPCRGATQAGGERRSRDFGPGEIIKQRVDTLPGHQLPGRMNRQQTDKSTKGSLK